MRPFAALALMFLLLPLCAVPRPSVGQESEGSGLPLPRFATLRADEARLRTGPGQRYPIDWVYQRKGLPVEIIEEYENWRRILDVDGTVGWVHSSLLDGDRSLIVTGEMRALRSEPQEGAPPLAHLQPGVILALLACEGSWCQGEVQGYRGWLRRDEVWGVYPDEVYP